MKPPWNEPLRICQAALPGLVEPGAVVMKPRWNEPR